MKSRRLIAAVLALIAWPAIAGAQIRRGEDPLDSMTFRAGPFGLSPSIAITDVGVDSNIFNESGSPREDFTATITPQVVARLRAGRLLLSAGNATGFVYYLDFDEERSVNYTANGRADFDFGWFQPFVSGDLQDTHERLNEEIDVRAGRLSWSASAGARLLIGSRSAVLLTGRVHDLEFDPGTSFEGVPLPATMNRRVEAYEASLETALTPLTTLVVTSAWQRDRFNRAAGRDSTSVMVLPALQFDPVALLQGTLGIGYRRFEPESEALPAFSGVLVRTGLTYVLLERTRFELRASRDVHYSFEVDEPYYVSTGARLQITHRLTGPFDLQATAGRDRLSYRGTSLDPGERVDRVDLMSAGIGYHLAENARLGLAWEYTRRLSPRPGREYDRRRLVASLLYGI